MAEKGLRGFLGNPSFKKKRGVCVPELVRRHVQPRAAAALKQAIIGTFAHRLITAKYISAGGASVRL